MERSALDDLLKRYRFTGKEPLWNDIFDALTIKPRILERKPIAERIISKVKEFVQTFDDDMGGCVGGMMGAS